MRILLYKAQWLNHWKPNEALLTIWKGQWVSKITRSQTSGASHDASEQALPGHKSIAIMSALSRQLRIANAPLTLEAGGEFVRAG